MSTSDTVPQFFPSREQNVALFSGVQAQTFGVPPLPQVCAALQVPQLATVRSAPQLSGAVTEPQFLPRREQKAASVSAPQPQMFAAPAPPQVWGAAHVPQLEIVRD